MVVGAHLDPSVHGRLQNLHSLRLAMHRAQGFAFGGRLGIQLLMGSALQVHHGQGTLHPGPQFRIGEAILGQIVRCHG